MCLRIYSTMNHDNESLDVFIDNVVLIHNIDSWWISTRPIWMLFCACLFGLMVYCKQKDWQKQCSSPGNWQPASRVGQHLYSVKKPTVAINISSGACNSVSNRHAKLWVTFYSQRVGLIYVYGGKKLRGISFEKEEEYSIMAVFLFFYN